MTRVPYSAVISFASHSEEAYALNCILQCLPIKSSTTAQPNHHQHLLQDLSTYLKIAAGSGDTLEGCAKHNGKPSLCSSAFHSWDRRTHQIINLFLPKGRVPAPKVHRRPLFTSEGMTIQLQISPKLILFNTFFKRIHKEFSATTKCCFLPVASQASSVLQQDIVILPDF